MPFIHIKSLPFKQSLNVDEVIVSLSRDFSAQTKIAIEHVTITWDFFQPGHYAVSGRTVNHQPKDSHPILIDLLVPDFNLVDSIEQMLNIIAQSLAKQVGMPIENIFINCQYAYSSMVFDKGDVVKW